MPMPLSVAALVMSLLMFMAWSSAARANVTIEIYVAWDQAGFEYLPNSESGGLTRLNGDYQFTLPGVCGMEFHNIVSWHWSGPNGPIANLPNNGDPIPNNYNFYYTGPYSGCDNNILLFSTPATGSGEFPEGAERLVVQVQDMSDIWYLNESYNAIPEPEWPEDHEFLSICEMFPDACEGGNMTVCLTLFQPEDCETDEQASTLAFASDVARRIDSHLNIAQAAATRRGEQAPEIDRALTAAQLQAMRMSQYLKRLTANNINGSSRHRQITARASQQCTDAITKTRALSSKAKLARLSLAGAQCRNARSLIDSLGWREHTGQQEKLLKRTTTPK
jgi:hypothetical protein